MTEDPKCLGKRTASQAFHVGASDRLPVRVKRSLESMIKEHVIDALTGVDKEFAGLLLRRPAPLKYWMKYYAYLFLFRIGALGGHVRRLFIEPMPLVPVPA